MSLKKIAYSLRKTAIQSYMPFKKQYYDMTTSREKRGSLSWLVDRELKYGGYVTNVKRNRVGSKDTRTEQEIAEGGMTGGDRMLYHSYGIHYANHLAPFIESGEKLILAEVGILVGTGLAVWCDLFPKARVMGFDVDLSHTQNNTPKLKDMGAFSKNGPELHEFDQFANNSDYLKTLLNGDKVHICIDDGVHSDEAILSTFESFKPHLAEDFVYFIEDNRTVHKKIAEQYPELKVISHGKFTILKLKHN